MQLTELSKSYEQLKLGSSIGPDFNDAVQNGILALYSRLQEYVGTDDFTLMKSALSGVSWVWIGDDFVPPHVLAFDSPVKFTPYLYVVPSEISDFRELLLGLGEFQGPALVAILEGVSLNREEVGSLQLLPPWRLRGDTGLPVQMDCIGEYTTVKSCPKQFDPELKWGRP
ncbi:hypothetical protein NC652_013450 [Populus alba x Populus x berolinensis]|nr:hypothetical protein NC652_013450 [Populus alba x Populus x berolinensis]